MVSKSASNKPPPPSCPTDNKQRFKGVRMRSWGKWVSEIRLPNTRARLWLGSFTTAEQAALAFDVAVVCLRGRSATLNFPNSPPTYAPLGLPYHRIQELAAAAAASASTSSSSSSAPSSCEESESATISSSSRSDESEAATTSEMNSNCSTMNEISSSSSSSSCCSSLEDWATFAGLLERDEENEQSSPLDAALQKRALNMGSEWDELLWGFPMTAYPVEWDEPLLLLPPLPIEDDLPTIVEPNLWNL